MCNRSISKTNTENISHSYFSHGTSRIIIIECGIIIVVIVILSRVSHRIFDILLHGRRATERNLSAEEFVIQDPGSKWLLWVFWWWTHSILVDMESSRRNLRESARESRSLLAKALLGWWILHHNFFYIDILGTGLGQIRYTPDIKAFFSVLLFFIRAVINAKSYRTLRYWLISAFLYMSPDISEIRNCR